MKFSLLLLLLFSFTTHASIDKCIKKWNGQIPKKLSKACLFTNIHHQTVTPEVFAFTPKYPLYTDGMDKRRWIYLPNGAQIDNTNIDKWIFPQGTVLWKQFSSNGKILETRMLYKTGEAAHRSSWQYATFKWNEQQTDADYIDNGSTNVQGTIHDIPSLGRCIPCHTGNTDIVRGFDPIQLSLTESTANQNEVYLKTLIQKKIFTHQMNDYYKIPAHDEVERNALGYLHGNCGHCHNQNHGAGLNTGLLLRTHASDNTREKLDSIKTTINVPTTYFRVKNYRIIPGDSKESAIFHRLNSKQPGIMMAPIGRKTIDKNGVKLVQDWIDSL